MSLLAPGCRYTDNDAAYTYDGSFNQPGEEQDEFDPDDYLNDLDYLVVAYFEVRDGELGDVHLPDLDPERYGYYEDYLEFSLEELRAMQEDLSRAELLWEIVTGIFPGQYLNQIAYFEVFTDGVDDFYGSVLEVGKSQEQFILSLDLSDMFNADGELLSTMVIETVIHELGHIITLGPNQVAWVEEEDADPATYYIYEYDLDTATDAYLNRYFRQFWSDIYDEWSAFYYLYGITYEGEEQIAEENEEILQEYLDAFYNKHEGHFVTDYAATSPTEDIAETFMIFVLEEKPTGSMIQNRKIDFFYNYPELVEVRSHIRSFLQETGYLIK